MWQWLNGPGKVFRKPREGSTNYLGAYDKLGRLIRGNDALLQERKAETKETSPDEALTGEDERTATSEAAAKAKEADQKRETPKETLEDLTPFPLNKFFHSQPVLSEELKDEIYKRVVAQGSTVREVSMALHVEMSRVAAVIRLKTVEQHWARDVSLSMFPCNAHNPLLESK